MAASPMLMALLAASASLLRVRPTPEHVPSARAILGDIGRNEAAITAAELLVRALALPERDRERRAETGVASALRGRDEQLICARSHRSKPALHRGNRCGTTQAEASSGRNARTNMRSASS